MTKKLGKLEVRDLNEAYNKVLNWFFSYPNERIGLNDLSSALKKSKTTVKKIVNQLAGEGFLNVENLGNVWRISCNYQHPYNHTRKIGNNLIMVYESGVLNEIYKLIPSPKCITLFGSYRKGDDNEKSDIDIAVEIIGNEAPKIVELGVLPEFGYRKNILVHLYVFSRNNVDLNLFANIANGIVLDGFLEARP